MSISAALSAIAAAADLAPKALPTLATEEMPDFDAPDLRRYARLARACSHEDAVEHPALIDGGHAFDLEAAIYSWR